MLSDLKRHAAILRTIQKARPDLRKSLLKLADQDVIRCIVECADNTLKGHVHLSTKQKQNLKRHKKSLRRLVNRGERWQTKRKLIVQSGGFLLPLLTPLLGSLIANLLQ